MVCSSKDILSGVLIALSVGLAACVGTAAGNPAGADSGFTAAPANTLAPRARPFAPPVQSTPEASDISTTGTVQLPTPIPTVTLIQALSLVLVTQPPPTAVPAPTPTPTGIPTMKPNLPPAFSQWTGDTMCEPLLCVDHTPVFLPKPRSSSYVKG